MIVLTVRAPELICENFFMTASLHFIPRIRTTYHRFQSNIMCLGIKGEVCWFCLFVCGLMLFFNIWVHITTVPSCSSGTLTNVLPHWNAMWPTQEMTPTLSQYTDIRLTCRCAFHLCGKSHWYTQLPFWVSWVKPDWEILPRNHTYQQTLNFMMLLGWYMPSRHQKLGQRRNLVEMSSLR